jgi:hypothetical protein
MKKRSKLVLTASIVALISGVGLAQFPTAREAESNSVGTPNWTNDVHFQKDVFTFVRIKYSVNGKYGYGHTRQRYLIDFPDSDLNFSYRLQQITSLKVNPDGRVLELTDKELFDYPFIYIVEPGRLTFTEQEIPILRQYLLNGGFLMVDDFWGEKEWANFQQELRLVFPDRERSIALEHPIFHCVFDLKKPQIQASTCLPWMGQPGLRQMQEVHYRAILDKGGSWS